jgi:hypothetical protein
MSLPAFKSIARTALVALAIGGVALAAFPAQAAPQLGGALQLEAPIKPQLQQDGGDGQQTQMKKYGGGGYDDDDDYYDDDWCLTNKQIRKGLKHADFDDIDFVKELKHHRVRVEALYEGDGWVYSMRVDRCDGEVDQIKPLYEAGDFDIDF